MMHINVIVKRCSIEKHYFSDEEEEKKDYEKPDIELNLHEDEEEEEEEEWTEERKWVEETYDPIIVTAHQDSYIRFWNMEVGLFCGFLLHKWGKEGAHLIS